MERVDVCGDGEEVELTTENRKNLDNPKKNLFTIAPGLSRTMEKKDHQTSWRLIMFKSHKESYCLDPDSNRGLIIVRVCAHEIAASWHLPALAVAR
jgi:hypothetical protein